MGALQQHQQQQEPMSIARRLSESGRSSIEIFTRRLWAHVLP